MQKNVQKGHTKGNKVYIRCTKDTKREGGRTQRIQRGCKKGVKSNQKGVKWAPK